MLNKVTLIGRLGRDPEFKYTSSGSAIVILSVATNESWIDNNGQKQNKTEWHKVVVWGKRAETCNQYLSKGSMVCIEGKIRTDMYEKDGEKRYSTSIIAMNVIFLNSSQESNLQPRKENINAQKALLTPTYSNNPSEYDDIPF